MIYTLGDKTIKFIGNNNYISDTATIVGSVEVGNNVSIWCNAVVRGDDDLISIGNDTNIQDSVVLHTDTGFVLRIGERVTVGHMAMLHGCDVGDDSLIGIRATILNGATIGRSCIIGAGAFIAAGKNIPDRSVVIGAPGRIVREITEEEMESIRANAKHYVEQIQCYKKDCFPF